MPRSWSKGIAGTLLLPGALACSGKGTDPKPVKYNVYVGCDERGVIYVLDTDSLAVTDSLIGIGPTYGMEVSPDGRWLYVQCQNEEGWIGRFLKIDLRSKQEVARVEEGLGYPLLLKNGMLMLVGVYPRYYFVDPVTLSEVAPLADTLWYGRVAKPGTKLPVQVINRNLFRLFDVDTRELTGGYVPHLVTGDTLDASLTHFVLHQDERRLLIINESSQFAVSWLLVGDMETRETLLQHRLAFAHGSIAISTDGAYAVVTDLGSWSLESPPITVDVFDLRSKQHLRRFWGPFGGTGGDGLEVATRALFVPDERRAILAPCSILQTYGPLQILNVETMALEQSEETFWAPFDSLGIGGLAVGPKP